MNTVAQTIGANVRRLRRNRGLSLVELGQHAGIAKGTLTQLEAGRGNPTLDTIQALGRALGVAVADLVTEHADDTPLVVRADGGTPVADSSLDAHLIHRSHSSGAIAELYRLTVEPPQRTESPAHPYGVLEQLYVLSGTLAVGPLDAMVTAGPHDFVQFHGDRPHAYEAIDGPTSFLLLMTFPSFSLETTPFRVTRPAAVAVPPVVPQRRPAPPQVPARGKRPATRAPAAGKGRHRAS